jgi:hypothetical protein
VFPTRKKAKKVNLKAAYFSVGIVEDDLIDPGESIVKLMVTLDEDETEAVIKVLRQQLREVRSRSCKRWMVQIPLVGALKPPSGR